MLNIFFYYIYIIILNISFKNIFFYLQIIYYLNLKILISNYKNYLLKKQINNFY